MRACFLGGSKYFKGGPNATVKFGPGVQLLRGSKYYVTGQGEFEAMKSLSGWEAARCDEHPFRAKIKVSSWVVFELSLLDKWSAQRKNNNKKKTKNGTFATAHFFV